MLVTCCLHITIVLHFVFYQVKLYLRSNRCVKTTASYNSTDNFGPRFSVFDWLISCFGNLILHQKINEIIKTNFMMKNNKKMPNTNSFPMCLESVKFFLFLILASESKISPTRTSHALKTLRFK